MIILDPNSHLKHKMSVVDLENSDSSDDIFVVKQIKPVNKLTLQQALIIKYGVLNSLNSKRIKNKKKKHKKRDRSTDGTTVKRKIEQVDGCETSTKKSLKVDRDVKSQTSKRNEEISSNLVREHCSPNAQEGVKQNIQEKEKQLCSSESEIGKKRRSILSPSNTSCTPENSEDLKQGKFEISPNISRKKEKFRAIESKQNEEKLMPNVTGENKKAASGVSSTEISSVNDGIVKNEVKEEVEESNERKKEKFKATESKQNEEKLMPSVTGENKKVATGVSSTENSSVNDGTVKNEVKEEVEELNEGFPSRLISTVNAFEGFEEGRFQSNSELLGFLLKKIIKSEIKKQIYLQQYKKSSGEVTEKLLSETDCQVLEKFFNLDETPLQVLVRMLGRKKDWHRVCTINYKDISNNLESEFQILHRENFVDINIEDEDLKTQMNLLNKSEVLLLCKAFNISFKSGNLSKKGALIDLLIEDSKRQKSVSDMFKRKTSSTARNELLKSKVKENLGMCIKLSDTAFEAFYKIILLHSFPHYSEEEDKRFTNELYMSLQVHKNFIKFPHYEVSPIVVFETQTDFDEYKKALLLYSSFENAINNKNHDEFIFIFNKAKEEFKRLLKNNEYLTRVVNLKSFIRKFSAGTVYARILTKFCKTFKKISSNSEKIMTTQLLLDQNIFLTGKKGEWYEILLKAMENEKNYQSAAEIIIKSFEDPLINEVQKLTLQLRGQSILKKKNSGVIDIKLREILDDVCTLSVQEPPSIEIKGKALSVDQSSSRKSVYIQDYKHGKMYSSVEERALSHYKSNGFTKGYHVEGFIVQSIYFLLFYDIIYGSSVDGVFQSPYQVAPLDFFSASFYDNRKEEIDLLLGDMLTWSNVEMEEKIKDVYNRNYKTSCIIKWDDQFTPDLFIEVIRCITIPILVLIFQRFIRNFRVFQSGFPDLTLWNPKTNKCKFVEVKSPNDRLSPAQRVWLDYLRSIGLDCEVCNVKNFSGKNLA